MAEILVNAIIGLVLGAAAGALGAYLGWASGTDPFISRKFVTGLITGAISGLMIAFGSLALFQTVADDIALLIIYGEIFGSALGITLAVPKISGAVTTRLSGTDETKPAPTT